MSFAKDLILLHKPYTTPQEYRFSVDWRFWVKLQPASRVLIVTKMYDGFAQPLAQVYDAQLFTFENSELQRPQPRSIANHQEITSVKVNSFDLPFGSQSFDLIVVPDIWFDKERLVTLLALLKTGGIFVIGFYNKLNFLKPHKSAKLTYQTAKKTFKKAAFTNINILGTLTDHRIPAVLFPLTSELFRSALKRYYGHKIPAFCLHILSTHVLMPLTSRLLPAYILIATREISK